MLRKYWLLPIYKPFYSHFFNALTRKTTNLIKKTLMKRVMEITKELLEKVAKNARLELTEEEKKEFLPQLKEILGSFKKLEEADVQNLAASFQPIFIKNITRDDIPEPCLSQEEALQNTNLKKDGFFKGPKTI